jgi:hypothetical protein
MMYMNDFMSVQAIVSLCLASRVGPGTYDSQDKPFDYLGGRDSGPFDATDKFES